MASSSDVRAIVALPIVSRSKMDSLTFAMSRLKLTDRIDLTTLPFEIQEIIFRHLFAGRRFHRCYPLPNPRDNPPSSSPAYQDLLKKHHGRLRTLDISVEPHPTPAELEAQIPDWGLPTKKFSLIYKLSGDRVFKEDAASYLHKHIKLINGRFHARSKLDRLCLERNEFPRDKASPVAVMLTCKAYCTRTQNAMLRYSVINGTKVMCAYERYGYAEPEPMGLLRQARHLYLKTSIQTDYLGIFGRMTQLKSLTIDLRTSVNRTLTKDQHNGVLTKQGRQAVRRLVWSLIAVKPWKAGRPLGYWTNVMELLREWTLREGPLQVKILLKDTIRVPEAGSTVSLQPLSPEIC
ncbi:uncharacterized protein AB675_3208 [Cyphellophora attinorum]|uniref:Uncharacterized protein n=1 Tax=Cyphellophora attinorum TaxID=1664694 RepID=A0A0N1H119_9EURO|nr:uncharacterized protein AB675_3208 [Phialophora attinorum]KPI37850.1 hypothetical protein AB675_3208 [Phialophora attinorum]